MFTLRNFTVSTITPCSVWIWWWKGESIRFFCRKNTNSKDLNIASADIHRLLILCLLWPQYNFVSLQQKASPLKTAWQHRNNCRLPAIITMELPSIPAVIANTRTEGFYLKILSQSLSLFFWMMEFEELTHIVMPGRGWKFSRSLLTPTT